MIFVNHLYLSNCEAVSKHNDLHQDKEGTLIEFDVACLKLCCTS